MKRETIKRILLDHGKQLSNDSCELDTGETMTVLFGRGSHSAITEVVRVQLEQDYFVAHRRRQGSAYVEYDMIRALTFENPEASRQRPGFV